MPKKKNTLITPEYRALNSKLHENERYGTSGAKYVKDVIMIAEANGYKTVLDYGCGKGEFKAGLEYLQNPLVVHEYDPAIPGKDKEPPRRDMVLCSDVLEHVEPELLDNVIAHIATKGEVAYFIIAMTLAEKNLPDGRNAHLTVEQAPWWLKKLEKQFNIMHWQVTEFIIAVVAETKPRAQRRIG
ncbi:MAG: hypothetical protein GKS03_12045 [Alphaproteobacteria bacterium]|nr:hypothetical protein [Alphaproteobacteria bacterium]